MGLFDRRVQITCAQCGKEFSTPKSKADKGAKYCGAECFEIARHKRVACVCEVCGKKFELRPAEINEGQGKFCSWGCYNKSRIKRVECICQECGKKFEAWPSEFKQGRGKYCSKACASIATGRERRRDFEKYICEQCGKAFEAKLTPAQLAEGDRRFCSRECFDRARTQRIEKTCEFCGKRFEITAGREAREAGRFCSRKCADTSRRQIVNLICAVCHKQFQLEPSKAVEGRGKFCSRRCALRYRGETDIEKLMRQELERQHEPFDTQVQFKRYHVDFVLARRRVVIECDGKYWHSMLDVFARDRRKDEYLKNLGYQVFRFNDQEIRNSPTQCLNQVLAAAPVVSSMAE